MANTIKNSEQLCNFRDVLSWYEAMGVDATIQEQPLNWLEEAATIDKSWIVFENDQKRSLLTPTQQNTPTVTNNQQTHAPEERRAPPLTHRLAPEQHTAPQTTAPLLQPSIEQAKTIAKSCQTLESLQSALLEFDGCALKRTAKNLVFYRGAQQAPLMVIGEAPGRDEDIVGKPFVGPAGQLLDRMLKAINIESKEAHITNIVYWRPPGNRPPTEQEVAICRPFLDRQIELVNPKTILFLGGTAAKQMYQTPMGITKLRGKWKKIPGDHHQMDTIATLHPAYLLRTPIAKRLAWQDLQLIAKKLES